MEVVTVTLFSLLILLSAHQGDYYYYHHLIHEKLCRERELKQGRGP